MQQQFRIDQILPSFCIYDAIGTETRVIRDEIRTRGFKSDIFAEEGAIPGECKPISEYFPLQSNRSIIIHHFSIGSLVPYYLMNHTGMVITRYHNITPPRFFAYDHNRYARSRCIQGRSQLPLVRKFSNTCWSVSKFNAKELEPLRFQSNHILPVMRNYESLLKKKPCKKTCEFLRKDPRKTILFVGRVIPNKAHHDLLFALSQYRRFVNPDIRLICVGSIDTYYARNLLKNFAKKSQLKVSFGTPQPGVNPDVIFAGSVSNSELVSHYLHAEAFVCLSDHEGFCVPLVEAMSFGLPVLAHNAAAVPETLGQAGLITDKKYPAPLIEGLYKILNEEKTRSLQKKLSLERATNFSWNRINNTLHTCLDQSIRDFEAGPKTEKSSRWGYQFSSATGAPTTQISTGSKSPVH